MNIIKSIKIVGCAVLVAGLSSCVNNWLDTAPSDSVDADQALNNSTDLLAARTGMYKALKGSSSFVDYYGRQYFSYGEIHAGDDLQAVSKGGSGRADFFYDMKFETGTDFDGNAPWQSPYIAIGRANRIIAAVDGGTLNDKEDAKATLEQYKAEALVIRALAHFDLVRIYGKPYTEDQGASLGVPVVTEILDAEAKPARNTVKEVYDQVIKDLTEAIDSKALPTDLPKTGGYVNAWSAKGILCRVYLNQGDYAKALSTAEDIIKNSPFKLWERSEYLDAWSADKPNEDEFLFRLNSTNSNDAMDLVGIGNVMSEAGYGDMVATKSFVQKLTSDETDIRNEIFLPVQDKKADYAPLYGNSRVFLNKFRGIGSTSDGTVAGNLRIVPVIPIIRLSEIYLTAAEAAFKTGDKALAAEYLNDLMSKRYGDYTTKQKVDAGTVTLDKILLERRKELVGEGQRYFDALRNNETIVRYTNEQDKGWHKTLAPEVRSFNRDYYKAIAAIPQSEINANPNIQQNPNYGK